jgi:hypothetical protein
VQVIGPDMIALMSTFLNIQFGSFVIFVGYVIISLGIGLYIRFGAQALEFSSLGLSFLSAFYSFIGNDYFDSFSGGYSSLSDPVSASSSAYLRETGLIYFFFVSFFISIVLSNVFINVTGDIYSNAHRRCRDDWAKAVDNLMISQEWSDATGGTFRHLQALATAVRRYLRPRRLDIIHPMPLVGMGVQEWPRDFSVVKQVSDMAAILEEVLRVRRSCSNAPYHVFADVRPMAMPSSRNPDEAADMEEGTVTSNNGFAARLAAVLNRIQGSTARQKVRGPRPDQTFAAYLREEHQWQRRMERASRDLAILEEELKSKLASFGSDIALMFTHHSELETARLKVGHVLDWWNEATLPLLLSDISAVDQWTVPKESGDGDDE